MTRSTKREDGAGGSRPRSQAVSILLASWRFSVRSGVYRPRSFPRRAGSRTSISHHFDKTHASMSDHESAVMADASAAVHPCASRAAHSASDQPEPREASVHAPDTDDPATSEPREKDECEKPSSLASGNAASTQDALQHSQETEPVTVPNALRLQSTLFS